jgi:hypothetical protein
MHRDLVGLKRVPELLDECEATDCLLMHGGGEEHVAVFTLAFCLIKGRVGVLDQLGAVLARPVPDHYSDARVLHEVLTGKQERLAEHGKDPLCDLFGLGRRSQSLGQVEELVTPEAAQSVRGARHLFEAARERHQQLISYKVAEGAVHSFEVV